MSPLLMVALIALNTPHGAAPSSARPSLSRIIITQPLSASAAHDDAALRATIDSGIVMLEARDYRAFLLRFASPEYRDAKSVDAMLEEFQEEKAGILLKVLKEIHRKTPVYADSQSTVTTATFKLKHRPHMHNSITFELHDGLWYIRN